VVASSPVGDADSVGRLRTLGSIYGRIARTYRVSARSLLLLAVIVFVPLGLFDAITLRADLGSVDFSNGLQVVGVLGALAALTVTGLVGEVFYSGAVAISLTHPEHGKPPPLRAIARRLKYGRLIAVDLLYGLFVTVGLVALVAPGVLLFVWLGLAGPVVEMEGRTVRGAFIRSWRLVRGSFWTVMFVLVPIEIVGDAVADGVAGLVHHLLGESLVATWAAETLSNIAFTPVFAVAAVLLTIDLIAKKDGSGPGLNPTLAEAIA
jgi:hypothetical protein